MKRTKLIALALMVLLAAAVLCGCRNVNPNGPTQIDIPTTEPTEKPVSLDPGMIDGFLGDWYGVYTVTDAVGMYAENAGVKNDCALRVALDSFGSGSCYLAVNGMEADAVSGSANVFALCTASLADNRLSVKGMINRLSVDWSFVRDGALLKLSGRYGDDNDGMGVEIVLARPDELSDSGLAPAALAYIANNGWLGIVDRLGGSTAELPAVSPAEGFSAHDFFTNESADTGLSDFGRIKSVDGRISLSLPEKYIILQNDADGIAVAAPDEGIWSIDFTVSGTEADSLSFLLSSAPGSGELCHYTIDGFDFYGAFVESSTPGIPTAYKLCGTDGSGTLIIIDILSGLTAKDAYNYMNVRNDSFRELILGARFDF